MVYDMSLAQVKTPAESTGEWDLYKIISTIPGGEAFRPLYESKCKPIKQAEQSANAGDQQLRWVSRLVTVIGMEEERPCSLISRPGCCSGS